MSGESAGPPGATEDAAAGILVRGLTREFDGHVAVDHLDLTVPPGLFFGFLGPNGAGKSTTIKMLTGMLRPTSGTARVLGLDPAAQPVEVKRLVGILPEEIHTYERLSGWELLEFTGRMHGLGRDETARRAGELLDLMELSSTDRHKLVVDYSMGMKKKTLLACAMIHSPRILFLDEPFNGIDAVTGRAIRGVLSRLVGRGVTVFFSSHVMETVERLCSRIAIIHRGRLQACGTLDEVRASAGLAGDTSLEELFVHLVGGPEETSSLEWLE